MKNEASQDNISSFKNFKKDRAMCELCEKPSYVVTSYFLLKDVLLGKPHNYFTLEPNAMTTSSIETSINK